MTTKELNGRQVQWWETLAQFNFRIKHVKGTENGRADALSRKEEYTEGNVRPAHALFKKDGDTLVFDYQQLAATTARIATPEALIQQLKSNYRRDVVLT